MRRLFFALAVIAALYPQSAFGQGTPPPYKQNRQFREVSQPRDVEPVRPITYQNDSPLMSPSTTDALVNTRMNVAENLAPAGRVWGGAEYMLFWIKNGPQGFPLVTTGDPTTDPTAGALGSPSTRVLFGGNGLDYGTFSGMRATLGGWVDPNGILGAEISGFLLESRSVQFGASSDAAGNPALYVPYYGLARTGGPGEDVQFVADSIVGFAGSVAVASTTRLWGAEANGVVNFSRTPGLEINFLGGFRYLDLAESLGISSLVDDQFFPGTQYSINDSFKTRNQFYGGQVGVRGVWNRGRIFGSITGKLALGVNHEVVDISGYTTQSNGGVVTAGNAGGLFAQTSNIGRRTSNQFAMLPEVDLKVGYYILPRLKAYVGYDFMWLNQVVRPGSQMDRSIDSTQNPLLFNPNAPTGGGPRALFDRTDFWAQGVTFGFEFAF